MKQAKQTEITDKTEAQPEVVIDVKTTGQEHWSTEVMDKPRRLTIKQKKFVANKIKGDKNAQAYVGAGYKASNQNVANVESSKLLKKPNIQQAIDDALEFHEATPEFAVKRLKQIASQDKEIGAARLASKDLLELHGWRKNERPTVALTVNQAFFGKARPSTTVSPE